MIFFISLKNDYQSEEQIMREGTDFKFESVDRSDYKLHKIKLRRGRSYMKSPKWIRNKRAIINPKNDDNCFQYALTVALNSQNIENHPEQISNIKLFINEYNWEGIDFSSHQDGHKESEERKNIMLFDCKKFEQNNETIALNILYVPHNKKEICSAYESKYNRKRENQVILLMIADGEKWHYLAVKILSRLLYRITSNHHGDFYCLGCLHSFLTDSVLKKHGRLCGNHDYCRVAMPEEGKNILKYHSEEKSLKAPFTLYADFECFLIKEQSCQNNPKKPYTKRKAMHKPSGYSLSLICSFDSTKSKRYL